MYPYIRMAKELFVHRNDPPIAVGEAHVSQHMCWPWDIDPWKELNNGRTLTLYDLGRIPMARRAGLVPALRRNGWGMAIAGASVRYRRRIHMFDRIEMRSRVSCWDARFIYVEQSLWKQNGDCASHALLRTAVTSREGIVAPERLIKAMGQSLHAPAIPDWIAAWIEAEDTRPWPPMGD
ncbi:acyl-CoA thioesterase [Roseivivax marinus]|uniref:acyl-CoA thioesterase n=1 Tax=Roseivivax marinus TaxID=1379903 RepID=UPI0008C38D6E|nr:acyl-CoA thioesterase [Roseivivax marinus]UMA64778.1 acyl-CoA thioesterase [Roseivivax marinus]SEL24051.1 Acyl-CoA thioesterase FadM [Roseivivax marinus]